MKSKQINVVLIIILVLFIFSGMLHFLLGYIPIIGRVIANGKLSKYAGNSVNSTYSFPYGDGYSAVLENGVTVTYDLKQNTIFDSEVSNSVQIKIDDRFNEIKPTLDESLLFPDRLWVRTWFDADDYNNVFHRLDILSVFNNQTLDVDESLQMPSKIAQEVIGALGSDYNFRVVYVIYADTNGMYECLLKLKEGDDLDENLLIESTTKFSKSELPEDYLQWLDQQ